MKAYNIISIKALLLTVMPLLVTTTSLGVETTLRRDFSTLPITVNGVENKYELSYTVNVAAKKDSKGNWLDREEKGTLTELIRLETDGRYRAIYSYQSPSGTGCRKIEIGNIVFYKDGSIAHYYAENPRLSVPLIFNTILEGFVHYPVRSTHTWTTSVLDLNLLCDLRGQKDLSRLPSIHKTLPLVFKSTIEHSTINIEWRAVKASASMIREGLNIINQYSDANKIDLKVHSDLFSRRHGFVVLDPNQFVQTATVHLSEPLPGFKLSQTYNSQLTGKDESWSSYLYKKAASPLLKSEDDTIATVTITKIP